MVTILIPSATIHRTLDDINWMPCDGLTETLLASQQLDASGTPKAPGKFCIVCARFCPTDKTFWTRMRQQKSALGCRAHCYSRRQYDYMVEGWCNIARSGRKTLLPKSSWNEECHACGDGSWVQMCPKCAVGGWFAVIQHKDANCVWHQLKLIQYQPSEVVDPLAGRIAPFVW